MKKEKYVNGIRELSRPEFEKLTGLHFTTDHTGKMKGLWSLSTSPLENRLCMERAKNPDLVCSKCYSCAMNKQYSNLEKALIRNTAIICNVDLKKSYGLPVIGCRSKLFRFEAFGDLINELQVKNYFDIAAFNPSVSCALWTKNPWIISAAMEKYGLEKPANLRIIGSSYALDVPMVEFYSKYPFIDEIFTVYTPEFAAENDVDINCGARSCATCKKCYIGGHKSYNIREKLK